MADITEDGCAVDLKNLAASCEAVRKPGGVKKRVWIAFLNNITGLTTDGDGYITTFSLTTASPPKTLYQFVGRKFKNSTTYEGQVGENYNSINNNVILALYFYTPQQRAAIEKLWNAEDVVVFVETEAGQIEVFGLDNGLNGTALAGGSGVNLQDSTALTVTLSGAQETLSKVLKTGATLQDDIDFLNGLTQG